MQHDHSLINLEQDTAYLRQIEDKGFPRADIDAERDRLFRRHFGYIKEELVRPVPPTVVLELKNETYDEIVDLAKHYGFDITNSSGVGVGLNYETYDDESEYDPDPLLTRLSKISDYWSAPRVSPPPPTIGYVIRHFHEWAEMLMAVELDLFPKTDSDLERVRLMRESKDFVRKAERDRHKPRSDDEKMKVFGRAVGFTEGTITPTARKGRPGAVREIIVEKVKSRRQLTRPGTRRS